MKTLFILTLLLGVVSCQKEIIPQNSPSPNVFDFVGEYNVASVTFTDILGETSSIPTNTLSITVGYASVKVYQQALLVEDFDVVFNNTTVDSLQITIPNIALGCEPYQIWQAGSSYYLRVHSTNSLYCSRTFKLAKL